MSMLFLSEDASEDAGSGTEDACAALLGSSVAAAGEGQDDVVEVHVSVSVTVLDDTADLAEDGGDQGGEGCAESLAEVQLAEDVAGEELGGEGRDRAGSRAGLACKEILDEVDTTRSGSRLGKGFEDGRGKAAHDGLLDVGRDFHAADSILYLLKDEITDLGHDVLIMVVNYANIQKSAI